MTKRDFFLMLIRLFALYWFVALVISIGYFFSTLGRGGSVAEVLIFGLASYGLMLGLLVILVLQSHKVVDFLNLDKGFEEPRIELGNLKETEILKLGVIIVGGLLTLDAIPGALIDSIAALTADTRQDEPGYIGRRSLWINVVSMVIGIILVTNYDRIGPVLNREKN